MTTPAYVFSVTIKELGEDVLALKAFESPNSVNPAEL